MAIISLSITESPIQYVSGIPIEVSVDANIPCVIFYTLDGTDPTEASQIVVGNIKLPTDGTEVTLKLYATNGTDSTPIITQTYATNINNIRYKQAKFTYVADPSPATFGYGESGIIARYSGIALEPMDDPSIDGYSDGYDGTATGTSVGQTDKPFNRQYYDIRYSETDSHGRRGKGIGTLPANVTISQWQSPTNSNSANSKLFNPRALVIYQDGREPPADLSRPLINSGAFNSFNPEKTRGGQELSKLAHESSNFFGRFVGAHHNSYENTTTYYYRDSLENRWIISKEQTKSISNPGGITNFILPKTDIAKHRVFKWFLFKWSCHY